MQLHASDQRRNVLCAGARLLSPSIDLVRRRVQAEILLQHMWRVDHPLTLDELEERASEPLGDLPGVQARRVHELVTILSEVGDLTVGDRNGRPLYFLSARCREELTRAHDETAKRCSRVLRTLFGLSSNTYREPFLEVVFALFEGLAGDYVLQLAEGAQLETQRGCTLLNGAVDKVASATHGIDPERLSAGASMFFHERGKDFSFLKWRIVQSFFVLKALGLDRDSLLFTKALYNGATFVVDTHQAIDALEIKRDRHRDFATLVEAASSIGIDLVIARQTLKELSNWVARQRALITSIEQGANHTVDGVDHELLGRWYEGRKRDHAYSVDDLLAPFQNAEQRLYEEFGVHILDDQWLWDEESRPETNELAQRLMTLAQEKRGHRKTLEAARHDAVILRWIERNWKNGTRTHFLTSDTTFRGSGVVQIKSVLDWLSPWAGVSPGVFDSAQLFADLLRRRLLPARNLFDADDLQVLVQHERECASFEDAEVEALLDRFNEIVITRDPMDQDDRSDILERLRQIRFDPVHRLPVLPISLAFERGFSQELERILAENPLSAADSFLEEVSEEDALELGRRAARHALGPILWRAVAGEVLNTTQVSELLGITRQAIAKRVRHRSLLALPGRGITYFPSWQFDIANREVRPVVRDLLPIFAGSGEFDPFSVVAWAHSPQHEELDGLSPQEWIIKGLSEKELIRSARRAAAALAT